MAMIVLVSGFGIDVLAELVVVVVVVAVKNGGRWWMVGEDSHGWFYVVLGDER